MPLPFCFIFFLIAIATSVLLAFNYKFSEPNLRPKGISTKKIQEKKKNSQVFEFLKISNNWTDPLPVMADQ